MTRTPQRRGEQLRSHVLSVAKEVFLEAGFERASMDSVAVRAGTSKRSLYAHFENKETLFLAVLDLVRDLHLKALGEPADQEGPPSEALTAYCARFLQLLVWEPQIRTCRLAMAEAERLPDNAYAYFEGIFATTLRRIAEYLQHQFALDDDVATARAHDLVARCVLPRLLRTLFGVEAPSRHATAPTADTIDDDVDVDMVRRVVIEVLGSPPPRE